MGVKAGLYQFIAFIILRAVTIRWCCTSKMGNWNIMRRSAGWRKNCRGSFSGYTGGISSTSPMSRGMIKQR